MQTTKTKEELLQENGVLKNEVEKLQAQNDATDVRVRTQLSSILARRKIVDDEYHMSRSTQGASVLSWLEIAAEIGKLLAKDDFTKIKQTVEKIDGEVAHLHEKFQPLEDAMGMYQGKIFRGGERIQ